MKYISAIWLFLLLFSQSFCQNSPVEGFLNGKSAVLISVSASAQPSMTWQALAEELHMSLVEAGGDPIAYYELEDVVLSEVIQAAYSNAFSKRLIENIIIITRKDDGTYFLHIFPYSKDSNIIKQGENWSTSSKELEEFKESIVAMGANKRSENYLVIEVPEYPPLPGGQSESASSGFIRRAPLNLDVFKLGVMLTGSSGDSGYLTTFRHDLFGKSPAQIEAEQREEREGLESVFSSIYPYEVEFITEPKPNQALIQDRVQFLLMRLEGREADLMENMGVPVGEDVDRNRIVVKYYIRFLVRNELYIGEKWDAHPDWRQALKAFLTQISTQ